MSYGRVVIGSACLLSSSTFGLSLKKADDGMRIKQEGESQGKTITNYRRYQNLY